MSEAKHTQGRWVFDSRDRIVAVRGPSAVTVARLRPDENEFMERAEINANARFIVRACNAHDNMLVALELALATIERIRPPAPHDSTSGTREVIRAAIAKAKGG